MIACLSAYEYSKATYELNWVSLLHYKYILAEYNMATQVSEFRGRMVNTPASCLAGPGFRSRGIPQFLQANTGIT
jgi:hypothetical protein